MDWLPFVYETNTAKVLAEWDKKYRNTFVRLNGKLVVAKCVDESYLYFMDENGADLRIKVDTDQVVDGSFPQIGSFTHREQLMVFNRTPNRQFKKGLYAENCKILVPLQGTRPVGYIGLDFGVLKSAYKPVFIPPHALLEKVFKSSLNSQMGGAVSKHWGFKRHPISEGVAILFFREFAVAEVDANGECKLIVPSFRQEVADFNRDFTVGMTVV